LSNVTETPRRFRDADLAAGTPILKAKRRAVLMGMLSVGLSSVCGAAVADPAPLKSLAAVVDTLLPADDVSPSASTLRVDRDIADFVAENDMMTRLFVAALDWMDQLTDRPFSELAPSHQIEILAMMEGADFNAIPGRFYHIVRALAVEFYYARSEAIAGFPLDPAPQPNGYPPPWS
jgi:hypothetical protein